jgi:putative flippase GtrA
MVKKLFLTKTDNVSIQVFRYVLAGGVAYGVDYGSLIALTEGFGVYYLTSSAIAFLMGTVASYSLNAGWVFNKRTFESRRIEMSVFLVIGIIGLVLNQYAIWFFTERAGFYYIYSKVMATIMVFLVNFFARKYILFR